MRVLYHRGEDIGAETIVKEGVINEKSRPLILAGEDRIVFDAIHSGHKMISGNKRTRKQVENTKAEE